MKVTRCIGLILLICWFFLPAFSLAESLVPKTIQTDTLIRSYHKTFFGKKYLVNHRHTDDWRDYLIVRREGQNSEIVFEHDLKIYNSGNCNVRTNSVSEYEFKKDSLFFYTYTQIVELWDVTKPEHHYYCYKEVFVVRRTGEFVRVQNLNGKNDPVVKAEVERRLNEELINLDSHW